MFGDLPSKLSISVLAECPKEKCQLQVHEIGNVKRKFNMCS